MAGRPNWYNEHPPACTCVQCQQQRRGGRRRGGRRRSSGNPGGGNSGNSGGGGPRFGCLLPALAASLIAAAVILAI